MGRSSATYDIENETVMAHRAPERVLGPIYGGGVQEGNGSRRGKRRNAFPEARQANEQGEILTASAEVGESMQRAVGVRLLPLLHAMEDVRPHSAVLGMALEGIPLVLNIEHPSTWHLRITGGRGTGKSELLRTALVSLALTSRRSQLSLLGIDLTGRELTVLEALPHTITDVATEPVFAQELLVWLAEEIDRRRADGTSHPHILLAIDDVGWIHERSWERGARALGQVLRWGEAAGVHLFATQSTERQGRCEGMIPSQSALAEHLQGGSGPPVVGRFRFIAGRESVDADSAWMSASDLNTAVRLADAGWRATLVHTTSPAEAVLR